MVVAGPSDGNWLKGKFILCHGKEGHGLRILLRDHIVLALVGMWVYLIIAFWVNDFHTRISSSQKLPSYARLWFGRLGLSVGTISTPKPSSTMPIKPPF